MLEDDDITSWHVHDEVSSLTKINNSCQIKIRGILILNLNEKRMQEEFRNRAYDWRQVDHEIREMTME